MKATLSVDADIQFGSLCVTGTRVSASTVAGNVDVDGIDVVMDGYGLTREEIMLACWHEWRHLDGRTRRARWARGAYYALSSWPDTPTVDEYPDPPTVDAVKQ